MKTTTITVQWEDVPEHVKDTMSRILLSAIRREQEREQGKAG